MSWKERLRSANMMNGDGQDDDTAFALYLTKDFQDQSVISQLQMESTLEQKILKLCKDNPKLVNPPIAPNDIEVCHRIGRPKPSHRGMLRPVLQMVNPPPGPLFAQSLWDWATGASRGESWTIEKKWRTIHTNSLTDPKYQSTSVMT